ncbi:MAG: YdcF family protein [Gammaproteobacteria bacterium]|nr:YdcF family protein [Gammaproteobacteria bacterium]
MIGPSGFAMLGLSVLLIIISMGTSLLIAWLHTGRVARRALAAQAVAPDADLVVFGKKLQADGRPDADYQARLQKAVELANQLPSARIHLLGGDTSGTGLSEAAAGRDVLLAHGVDGKRLLLEEHSRHTLENIARLAEKTGGDTRLIAISRAEHLARCCSMGRNFGLQIIPCAAVMPHRRLHQLHEAFMLHWYLIGRGVARLLGNRHMLEATGRQ